MYRATIAISSFLFLLGVTFPVAAKFYNPFLAYGIVFISWPAFGIGAICGGMVGFFSKRDIPSNSTFFYWAGDVYSKYNGCNYNNLHSFLCQLIDPFGNIGKTIIKFIGTNPLHRGKIF